MKHFNQLTNPEKYHLLETEGTYLDIYRIEGHMKIALFSLHDFYCEVWLNQDTDRLIKAIAFASDKKLEPYLKLINISELYALL